MNLITTTIAVEAVSLEFGVSRAIATLDWDTLVLNPGVFADEFNGDVRVDAVNDTGWRDTLAWQQDLCADANGGQIVGVKDYGIWLANLGTGSMATASTASTSLPAPWAWMVASLAIVLQQLEIRAAAPVRNVSFADNDDRLGSSRDWAVPAAIG